MRKNYPKYPPLFAWGLFLLVLIASCKKDRSAPAPDKGPVPIGTIGLYELDSAIYRRVYIPIAKIGTQTVNSLSVFDTGSTGMTIDATGILPASMITNTGITVSGDSVVVNGITVTPTQAVVSFGSVGNETQEYGNLAYASVTLGDNHGTITTGRIPIFLYYKVINVNTGKQLPAHTNDVFGVAPGVSFANNAIGSPLSYFKTGNNVISGFKLARFNNAAFGASPTFVAGLLTVGLVPNDLTSAGFIMHPLLAGPFGGDSPEIAATVTYNGIVDQAIILFDTGTPATSIIEDPNARNTITLPANSVVSLSTPVGFTYQYTTTATYNLTQVTSPNFSNDSRTIFSIDFFIENEFLTDYTNHRIGLKNN
jgi:hypothetical protein